MSRLFARINKMDFETVAVSGIFTGFGTSQTIALHESYKEKTFGGMIFVHCVTSATCFLLTPILFPALIVCAPVYEFKRLFGKD